jgi:hypothetical protein
MQAPEGDSVSTKANYFRFKDNIEKGVEENPIFQALECLEDG